MIGRRWGSPTVGLCVGFGYGLILRGGVCKRIYRLYKFCFIKLLAHTSRFFFTHFMPSFSHSDCSFLYSRACLLCLFTVFNVVQFLFWMRFCMGFFGGWARNRTLSRQWKWLFLPLPCHILGEKTRLCLQEAELWCRLIKETLPRSLDAILEPNLDED